MYEPMTPTLTDAQRSTEHPYRTLSTPQHARRTLSEDILDLTSALSPSTVERIMKEVADLTLC